MKNNHLLVVEDSDTMRVLLTALLTAAGYTVTEATDGISALVAVENALPDLVVLDLHLPDMSGLEIANLLHQRIPFLVLTMDAHAENVRKCIELGALGYLVKPPDPDGFLRQIHIALKRGQESVQLRRALQETQTITWALGILVGYHRLPKPVIYKNLITYSMAQKQRVTNLAQEIIDAFDVLIQCQSGGKKPGKRLRAAVALLDQFKSPGS